MEDRTVMFLLDRVYSARECILGRLTFKTPKWSLRLYTLELQFDENKVAESAIKDGVYNIVWRYSEKFSKNKMFLEDVDGRTNIMIHEGNTVDDTEGCILVGMDFTIENEIAMLHESKRAVETLEDLMMTIKRHDIEIQIKNIV